MFKLQEAVLINNTAVQAPREKHMFEKYLQPDNSINIDTNTYVSSTVTYSFFTCSIVSNNFTLSSNIRKDEESLPHGRRLYMRYAPLSKITKPLLKPTPPTKILPTMSLQDLYDRFHKKGDKCHHKHKDRPRAKQKYHLKGKVEKIKTRPTPDVTVINNWLKGNRNGLQGSKSTLKTYQQQYLLPPYLPHLHQQYEQEPQGHIQGSKH